jgi:hypothetical protein
MLVGLAFACEQQPSREVVAEAAALDRGIDVVRQALNVEKSSRLQALRELPCSEPALCELKRECVKAYTRHVAALDEVAKVKGELNRAPAETLEARLERARLELIEAQAATQGCVTLQSGVRERYGLSRRSH